MPKKRKVSAYAQFVKANYDKVTGTFGQRSKKLSKLWRARKLR